MSAIHYLYPKRTPLERKLLDLPLEDDLVIPFDAPSKFELRARTLPLRRAHRGRLLATMAGGLALFYDVAVTAMSWLLTAIVVGLCLFAVLFVGAAL